MARTVYILCFRRKTYLSEQDNQEDTNILQKHSNTGRPLGGIKFIEKIEKLF